MTATTETKREHFLRDMTLLRRNGAPGWFAQARERGAARFQDLAFPTTREEIWRFTNVAPIVNTAFRSVVDKPAAAPNPEFVSSTLFDGAGWNELVFLDGIYAPALSRTAALPKGVYAGGLAEAAANGAPGLADRLGSLAEPRHAFVALNGAFLHDGAYVYVPKNTKVEPVIHLAFIETGLDAVAVHPRVVIVLEEGAEAVIVEQYRNQSAAKAALTNAVAEISIGPNASLERYRVVDAAAESYHLSTTQFLESRDSRLHAVTITLNGKIVRNELNVLLDGEGGQCALDGLYLNEGDHLIDNALSVRHAKGRCFSRMGYKGVLAGKSKAVFTGKVNVDRNAQKTDSNQLNNNLLLSDDATIDTKPQLEIYADDVKCTHGATVGGFPSALVFYFQSRGISAERARGILTYGFAAEVLEKIGVEPLRERLDKHIFDKYCPDPV